MGSDMKDANADRYRDLLCAMVWTAPIYKCDAIVVLCGEDAYPRLATATGLLQAGAAPTIVLSGGRHELPRWAGGESLVPHLLGVGVSPSAVLVEHGSQNTHEQAENVVDLAAANDWTSLLIVASAYHLPRAFLTFAQTIRRNVRPIKLLPVGCGNLSWFERPAGTPLTRGDLLESELRKIRKYQIDGHCAAYADGIAFMREQEGL